MTFTTVKELLGHKMLAMALRYSHLAASHMVNTVTVLDNTLNDKTSCAITVQSAPVFNKKTPNSSAKCLILLEPARGVEPPTC